MGSDPRKGNLKTLRFPPHFLFFCGKIKVELHIKPVLPYMRPLRKLQQGVWYEIRTSINNREPLFRGNRALTIFAKVFRETGLRFAFTIRGLRIEDDLLRFYIKPENGLELPAIMKWMKQVFAQRYNRAAGRTGHIWGDRYWSGILDGEPHEEGSGVAPVNGVRPFGGENNGLPAFPPVSPFPVFPAPG
jgi:REP element-mobilizing transposase RayT